LYAEVSFITTVQGETGPGPWLRGFEGSPLLRLIFTLRRHEYFFTLTNASVVVNSGSRWTYQPGEVLAVFPRGQFPATRYKRGRLGSSFYVQLPHASKPRRIDVDRYWRAELAQLVAAFPAQADATPVTG
jgi:hypothetical protein